MRRTNVAAALLALALLPAACSSKSGATPDVASASSGSGSGSGGAPSRPSATCAEATTDVGNGALVPGSWGNLPESLRTTPSGGTLCGAAENGGDAGLLSAVTIILTPDWDQQIFDFYNPLVSQAGCTLSPMTTTSGELADSYTSFTCPGGGIGTINASPDAAFIFLAYSGPNN